MNNNKDFTVLFPGKFQPPHLGHVITLFCLAREYRRVIILVTNDNPQLLSLQERVKILEKVFRRPEFNIISISDKLTSHDRSHVERLFKDNPFDIIVSGNPEVVNWALRNGLTTRLYPRSEGPGFSGTELREKLKNKNDIFVRHVERHLNELEKKDGIFREVCCKICDKTIDEIFAEDSKHEDKIS